MKKPNFSKNARDILQNLGKKTLNGKELALYLRKYWQDGYSQGWQEGQIDGAGEALLE